jgi:uroporphyrinogen decarboxylase
VIPRPVRTDRDLDALRPFDPRSVEFVAEAIRGFREAEPERPIVGFAGGPFTLAAYLVDGGASREYPETRRMLYADPDRFDRLLDLLTEMTGPYLELQARAGAGALQLFDTWAGILPAAEFERHLRPRLIRLFERLRGTDLPTIYFSTGSAHLLGSMRGLPVSAFGVDWRVPLGEVRRQLTPRYALQGNLDPGALLGGPEAIERSAQAVLDALPDHHAHVFNLGHGVLPETPPEAVDRLVRFVHERGRSTEA